MPQELEPWQLSPDSWLWQDKFRQQRACPSGPGTISSSVIPPSKGGLLYLPSRAPGCCLCTEAWEVHAGRYEVHGQPGGQERPGETAQGSPPGPPPSPPSSLPSFSKT